MIDSTLPEGGNVQAPKARPGKRRPYRRPNVKTNEAFESVSASCCKDSATGGSTS